MKSILAMFFAALLSFSNQVQAQATTGNQLLGYCKEYLKDVPADLFNAGLCGGLIDGTRGGVDGGLLLAGKRLDEMNKFRQYCVPDNATRGQLARVVVKHLESVPENLHLNAQVLIFNALKAGFPCN